MDVDELDLGESVTVLNKTPEKVHYLPKILNGGIAGIVGLSCVFPLDLVKTRLQNQRGTDTYKGILDCFQKILGAAGTSPVRRIKSLYRGASINVLLITPEKAIKLVANDFFRNALKQNDSDKLSTGRGMIAGGCAGFCQIIITTPMELLKIQMQQSEMRLSVMGLIKGFAANGGIRGFYRGLGPTMARDVTFSVIYFPLFAKLDSLGPRRKDGSGNSVFYASFISGLCSGAFASLCVTPLDVIKTRAQISGAARYTNVWTALYHVANKESPRALFKGAACRMMVMAPLFGIAQMVYYIGVAEYLIGIPKSSRV